MTIRPWLIAALLATAAVVLSGALSARGAQADPHPDHQIRYKVKTDLAGRESPRLRAVALDDFLHARDRVRVRCQTKGGWAYGSRIWDLVRSGIWDSVGDRWVTLYVPDRFIKTGTDGWSPNIPRCDRNDRKAVSINLRLPG